MIVVLLAVVFPPTKQVDIEFKVKTHTSKPEHKPRPTPLKASKAQKEANKKMAMRFARAGWNWDKQQRLCLKNIFNRESRFDNYAKNLEGSTAYGIAQMLNEKSSDPAIQLLNSYRYIVHRYGKPCNAWAFHLRHYYY